MKVKISSVLPISLSLVLVGVSPPPVVGQVVDSDIQIYANGDILTMSPDRPRASAMAVKDGRILAIGDLASVKTAAGDDYEFYDLEGATVTPGFIESHEHMMNQAGLLQDGFSASVLNRCSMKVTTATSGRARSVILDSRSRPS